MRLICSESLRSMAAMMSSIVLTTSLPMSLVCDSACCASVCTATSTALFASSVFGLNSFCSRLARSLPSTVTPASADVLWVSAMEISPVMRGEGGDRAGSGLVGGLRGLGQRAEQRRVGEQLGQQVFGARLAVHVRDEVGQLLPRLEQLVQRVDLARHGGGREGAHAVERDVDAD